MAKRRRRQRNPKLRDRLDPATDGRLGEKKENVKRFGQWMARELTAGLSLKAAIREGRELNMSRVQIRKALHRAINIVINAY